MKCAGWSNNIRYLCTLCKNDSIVAVNESRLWICKMYAVKSCTLWILIFVTILHIVAATAVAGTSLLPAQSCSALSVFFSQKIEAESGPPNNAIKCKIDISLFMWTHPNLLTPLLSVCTFIWLGTSAEILWAPPRYSLGAVRLNKM